MCLTLQAQAVQSWTCQELFSQEHSFRENPPAIAPFTALTDFSTVFFLQKSLIFYNKSIESCCTIKVSKDLACGFCSWTSGSRLQ